jgi:two-component system, cell cycle response regulator
MPLAPDDPRSVESQSTHHVPVLESLVTPVAEVLVIEDDELDRQLIGELLTLKGRGRFRVTEARDLRTGLDLLGRQAFDLVMLDTKLPEASALYALRAVGEQAPQTPILPHPAFLPVSARQTARLRGPFDAVVLGELNGMWSAVNELLGR